MSGTRVGWVVAASLGAVEALKDQGICRWNYAFRSVQQHAKTRLKSYYQNHVNLPAPRSSSNCGAAGMVGNKVMRDVEKMKRTEKSLKKVMDLSCWGPSTVRF